MEKKKIVYEEPLTKVFPIQVKGCFCQSPGWTSGDNGNPSEEDW